MDVTKLNFSEILPEIKNSISKASFITVDTELTGLTAGETVMAFDTPAERYQKLREGSMDFMVIQFGLCTFFNDQETDKYTYNAYNFYIFPNTHSSGAPDPRFLCQSSSMEFLVSCGFDFNKLIQEGIPYLNLIEEQKMQERVEKKQKMREQAESALASPSEIETVPIPEEQQEFIQGICKKIQMFISSSRESLQIDSCNGFQRKLIYQTARQRFKNIYLESKTTEKKQKVILVTKITDSLRKEKEETRKKIEAKELENTVGFSRVIREISKSGKLVIGHNMMLDVCHMLHQFISPLPAEYEEFKALTKCVLPRLLDTKLMANTYPFKDKIIETSLGNLLKIVRESPFKMPEVEAAAGCPGYSIATDKAHEAGYDAFVTGLCFIAMSQYLGTFQDPPLKRVLPGSALLEPFVNKLYVMRSHDIPYINIMGPDIQPTRDHVFHVTFPKDWQNSDLVNLFSPYGSVYIAWVSDTSAFVALNYRDQASLVQNTLKKSDTYSVTSYNDFKRRETPYPVSQTATNSTVHKHKHSAEVETSLPPKRRRSGSIGETSYSGRTISTIPEEEEEDRTVSPNKKQKQKEPREKKIKQKQVFEEDEKWE